MTQLLSRSAGPQPEPTRRRHSRPAHGPRAVASAVAFARRIGYWRVAAAIITVGSALRVYHWLTSGSFSQDETSLVINFAQRSFAGLRGGLEYDQVAPIGWLWTEKLAYTLAGPGEQSLRFFPLLLGCAGLVPMAFLARRLLTAPVALVALGLVAGSPQILYYSTQVKQYSAEVACTTLLLVLALRANPDPAQRPVPEEGRGRVVAFWATAGVTCWFATTSIFTAAVVGGLLMLFAAWRARWRRVLWHAVGGAGVGASIGAMYLAHQPQVPAWLTPWWTRHYPGSLPPETLTPYKWLRWTARCAEGLARQAMGVRAAELRVVLLVLVAVGLVALLARHRRTGVLVIAPVAAAYVLALFRLYPFGARLALWVVPILLIMACAGIDAAVRLALRRQPVTLRWPLAARWSRPVAAALAVLMAAGLAWAYTPTIGRRLPHNQLTLYARAEEAIRYVAAHRGAADQVYFGFNTARVAIWYGPRAGLVWHGDFSPVRGRACAGGAVAATRSVTAAQLATAPKVWVVLRASERVNPGRLGEFHAIMSRSAVLLRERRFNWIVVAEYTFTGTSTTPAAATPAPVVEASCYRFTGR